MSDAARLAYATSANCQGYAYTQQTVHSDYFEYCTHHNSDLVTAASAVEGTLQDRWYNQSCVGSDIEDDDSGSGHLGLSVFIAGLAGLALCREILV